MTKTTSLSDIDSAAKRLRESRGALSAVVDALQAKLLLAQNNSLPLIRKCVSLCAQRQAELYALVDDGRYLFDKPRTQVLHGIKVGLGKGKGKIQIDDEERTVSLIEKRDDAEALLIIHKSPRKEALEALPVDELKKLGCQVSETGDFIVIRPVDSAVDRAVKALLKSAIETATLRAARPWS